MNEYLFMNLEGPMMSFGGEAIDKHRGTDAFPRASMLTGLIGSALGYYRTDHQQLNRLQERIKYAARSERLAQPQFTRLTDYQTVSISQEDVAWTTTGVAVKRGGGSTKEIDIQHVEYITETRMLVAVTLDNPQESPTLAEIAQALQKPANPIYIGRKCCMPSAPIYWDMTTADNATAALAEQASTSIEEEDQVQWNEKEHDQSVSKTNEHWSSENKDWRNQIHTGRRTVSQGVQRKGTRE